MTSAELAVEVGKIHAEAISRILVEGDAKYATEIWKDMEPTSEQKQRFEHETVEDNLRGLEEELLDAINWASMTLLKLRMRRARAEENQATS